jgi:ferric-dicitrate binding protein FerR (iron transport regulator)
MDDKRSNPMTSPDDEKAVENLLQLAGERAAIPLGIESRVRHRVQEVWRAGVAQPNAQRVYAHVHKTWRRGAFWGLVLRWTVPIGVAASAALVVALVSQPGPSPGPIAATVAKVVGRGLAGQQYPVGRNLYAGDIILTGADEGLSLILARSESLRIDAGTEIRVDAHDRFTLFKGRVYADSGQFVYRNGGLTIDTGFGSVTDIGTQFSVKSDGRALEVAVREGRVNIKSPRVAYVAMVGERLTLAPGQGAEISTLNAYDDYWDWVGTLTPELDMTDKSLLELLEWAARETGRKLIFETDQMRMFAMRTTVTVPILDLTPEAALPAILATTTVSYSIEPDRIVIRH